MNVWETYPETYRTREVTALLQAVCAGECVSVVGLSGAGKSNLLGFLAHRQRNAGLPAFILLDGNRLVRPTVWAFLDLLNSLLGETDEDGPAASLAHVQARLERRLAAAPQGLCLLVDRLDALPADESAALAGSLRALRDVFKYALTFVVATRRPMQADSELAELFFANTIWVGVLSQEDARWSAAQYAARRGQEWGAQVLEQLALLSQGYPALLRAACEAYAAGAALESAALLAHPAVQRRISEFWRDHPTDDDLRHSGLQGHPWLPRQPAAPAQVLTATDDTTLTAAEHALLMYFKRHPGEVCSKDDLIAAVWSAEMHLAGLRDDSLAQLVHRLRLKIEPDPAHPVHVLTVPGRGYRYLG